MKRTDQITSIVFIIGSIILLYEASKIEDLKIQIISSRMFPQLIFTATIALAIALFIRSFTLKDSADQRAETWAKLVSPKRLIVLFMFTLYLLIIPAIGFLSATVVFLVVAIMVLSPQKKKDFPVCLAITGGLVGLIYLAFSYWLQVFLP